MLARVTTTTGADASQADAAIETIRSTVVPLATSNGGKGIIVLIDRETGNGLTISFWEDEATMQASEERANALRASVAGQMGVSDPAVARYEVAVFEV